MNRFHIFCRGHSFFFQGERINVVASKIQDADSRIRGVLGQSFLAHFDMLIDNEHKLLCLDETHAMREKVRGEMVQLVAPSSTESELAYTERLVLSVRLSGIANRQVLLQLDSGSDGPISLPNYR